MSLLEVEDLSVCFGDKEVVRGVSFRLDRGETLALVGESGSGKTLTALSLLQLLPPGARNKRGRIRLAGEEVIGADRACLQRLRGGVAGMIFQEPMTSLNPLHRIGAQIDEAIRLHQNRRLSRRERRARIVSLLESVGFPDAEHRLEAYPHELSGGQRQRVMIAMALANDPALLIADEPTTALDVTIQAQILALLSRLKASRGLALLLITHDLAIVRRYADRVCVMRHGEIVEAGRVAEVFAAPSHPYTRELLGAEPHGAPVPLPTPARPRLEAREIRVRYSVRRGILRRAIGEIRAVDGVSLTIRRGETVGVVGESGSGKTTLGFALLGLTPAEGTLHFEGVDLMRLDRRGWRAMRARMQIVFQDPFGSLSPRMTVGDIVGEGLLVHARHLSRREREAEVAKALEEVGLPADALHRYPHEFSGGQRQRIAIARALVLKPPLVVLDEPTSALDRSVQAQIIDLLRDLQRRYPVSYVFISHDLSVVRAIAHRVVVMRHGRIIEEGEAEEIFTRPRHPYTKALMEAAFDLEVEEALSAEIG
jgi:microcin C transport system ATP-binding protein